MRLPQTKTKKARIEIIPMIDAIFFLLVFFMFSSLSMVRMNGLPVALPKAPPVPAPTNRATGNVASPGRTTPATKPVVPRRLVLSIEQRDKITLDGDSVDGNDALARNLVARLRAQPDAVIVVRAATGVSAQRLIGVMDALNRVSLPGGKRPQIVVATVAAPPTDRSHVLPAARARGGVTPDVR